MVEQHLVSTVHISNGPSSSTTTIDLFKIPISALRARTRQQLSNDLNANKVLLSALGTPRDWRGVLEYLPLEQTEADFKLRGGDYMDQLLTEWAKVGREATLGALQGIISQIDRWDIVDDTAELFGDYF